MNTMLDAILDPGRNQDQNLFKIEKEILEHDRPNVWNIFMEGNMERVLEVDFQKFAIAVTETWNQPLEEVMVFTFYARVEYLKEKHK